MMATILFAIYIIMLEKVSTKSYIINPGTNEPDDQKTTNIEYVDNIKPYLLLVSIIFIFFSILCIVYIFTKFVNVFSSSKKPIINYILLVMIVLTNIVLFGSNIWYLFIRPPRPLPSNVCKNPLQYKDNDGQCKCIGDLKIINDVCRCPDGTRQVSPGSWQCVEGCLSDADCEDGRLCNTRTGTCCFKSETPCGNGCCPGEESGFKCMDDRLCCEIEKHCKTYQFGNICCDANSKCIDDPDHPNYQKCQESCGKNLICKDGDECFTMIGKTESIKEFSKSLVSNMEIKEVDIEIHNNNDDLTESTLSYCSKPKICEFTSNPQYFPSSLKSSKGFINYYPCLESVKLTDLAPPPQEQENNFQTPYNLNVCIPTPPKDPQNIVDFNDDYKKCFERIRPKDAKPLDASKCEVDDDCKLVNILHTDYSNPSLQDTIFQTISRNTLPLNKSNSQEYQGSFCGPNSFRIINNTLSTYCTDEEAAITCAELGAYSDSKYISYGKVPETGRRYCNTYFYCPDLSNESNLKLKQEKNKYFKTLKFGNIQKEFNSYNVDETKEPKSLEYSNNKRYIYNTNCPKLSDIDVKYWSGCQNTPTGSCPYKNCPGDLQYIQDVCETVNGGGFCDTNVCTSSGEILRVKDDLKGIYYNVTFDNNYPSDFKEIQLEISKTCLPDAYSNSLKNCFTYEQWGQLMYDYNFSLPFSEEVKNQFINSDGLTKWKMFLPVFYTSNYSSKKNGIVDKKEILFTGGSKCKWSVHLGIIPSNGSNCFYNVNIPNDVIIVKVKKNTDGLYVPVIDIHDSIGDGDTVMILGDDGYGNLFSGLGSWCNKESAPCIRPENANIKHKQLEDGSFVPDWDNFYIHPDNHSIFIITIEDDPYVYEELIVNKKKYLRSDRAFSLKAVADKNPSELQNKYLSIDENILQNCRECNGSAPFMEYHNRPTDPNTFMTKFTYVLSNTNEVVHNESERS